MLSFMAQENFWKEIRVIFKRILSELQPVHIHRILELKYDERTSADGLYFKPVPRFGPTERQILLREKIPREKWN